VQPKPNAPLVLAGHAHEESLCFVITSFIELIGRSYCCVLFATYGGAVPMAYSILIENDFIRPSGRRWKILSVKQ